MRRSAEREEEKDDTHLMERSSFQRSFRVPDTVTMGRVVELLLDADLLSKLSRYESSLQKQLVVMLKEIREMQASRANVRVGEENKRR